MIQRLRGLFFALILTSPVMGQDVGVTSIDEPTDGCVLTNNETVTVTIFNFDVVPITGFDVSYVINAGAPVTETVGAVVPAGGSISYSFTTPANLSTTGTYTFDSYTELGTDVDNSNDSIIGYTVENYDLSVGGSVGPDDTVCAGSNSGILNLTGHNGDVQFWEYSTDGGATWNFIANTTTSQPYNNLITTTLYRAIVRNGVCPPDISTPGEIVVYSGSVGGTVNSSMSVCDGNNSGTLTLTGQAGSVLDWEMSTDGGTTWTSLANTTTSQNYNNLTVETWYRAIVELAPCPPDTSSVAILSIDPVSVGGSVSGDATVCSGSNSGTVTLSGETGSVIEWVESTDGGATWSSIANVTTSHSYNNITTTTMYAAVVQSGSCPADTSTAATITVDPASVGGTVNSDATVCSGSNSGTLTLTGHTGTVLDWEFSTDGGATWTSIGNTTTSQNYTNLTVQTMYRAIVQSGVCPPANATPATISIDPQSVGGSVTADATVCSGSNSGTLNLAGETGSVVEWVESTDGGTTWSSIANTTTSHTYNNITTTTMYAAVVQSGTCPPDTSSAATITVDPNSVGGTVNSSTNVCEGSNSGTLTLTGETGSVVEWLFSTDGGATWTSIANTTNSQNYNNLTTTTDYTAVVQSGTCPADTATPATITVNPTSVGGSVASDATECNGANSGTLTLSGETGSVMEWLSSTDGGVTWTSIANTTNSQNYLNLTQTTMYTAVVQSGVCPRDTASPATITVLAGSVGGTLTPANDTVCETSNSGTINLSGETGNIVDWEFSTDGGATWTSLGNTTNTQNFNNLTTTTVYHAIVQFTGCPADTSSQSEIVVSPSTVAGTLSADQSVCSGTNSGTLNLAGETGSIVDWEFSTDGGATWNSLGVTTNSYNFSNLTQTTDYQVIVQSGACPQAISNTVTVTVTPPSVGGTISPANDTVCSGVNSGTLTLSGESGTIVDWEASTDGGATWSSIGNTTNTENYTNLTATTLYRVIVQLGTCAPDTSTLSEVFVDPPSVGGNINGSTTVCQGTNSDTLILTGYTGSVTGWESSDDNGATWTPIANPNDTLIFNNLTDTTLFRAFVTSGLCAADTSDTAMVMVAPPPVGGTIAGDTSFCGGSNSDTLFLTGYTGTVSKWISSTDTGNTWTTIVNPSDTLVYSGVTQTTWFAAVVTNSPCSQDTSSTAVVQVDPPSVGGNVTGGTVVCLGSGSDTLFLNGETGAVMFWESSIDSGATWTNIAVSSDTLVYSGLTDTTWFRAIVQSGVCFADTSDTAIVQVDMPSIGGTVTADSAVCASASTDTLFLNGHLGNILYWESSIDGGTSWSTIASTNDTLIYNINSFTTLYRAIVQNGVCATDTSDTATVIVSPQTVGGTITGSTTVCEGLNNGTLVLVGHVGNVLYWESSVDSGATWTNIANTTAQQQYNNLADTTWYRAIVQSTPCSIDTSSIGIIYTYPTPVAAFTVNDTCYGDAVQFMNQSTISGGIIQFTVWDFGDFDASVASSPFHTYGDTGTFDVSLVAISNNGCTDTAFGSIDIFPNPDATISASGDTEFCDGDSIDLSVMAGNYTYAWSTGDTDTLITVDTSGTYTIMVVDTATGCSSMDSSMVTVNPAIVADVIPDSTISLGTDIMLWATGGTMYEWSPDSTLDNPFSSEPIASPSENTTYQVVVTDDNNCVDTLMTTITLETDQLLDITNLFTPNADGFNDTWFIGNIENYPDATVQVFNRYGMTLMSQTGYQNDWDGTRNGKNVPDGTYYYLVTFPDSEVVYKGSVTILRKNE